MHGQRRFGSTSSSRNNSVHGETSCKDLHHGSHHGEMYVARKLARLTDGETRLTDRVLMHARAPLCSPPLSGVSPDVTKRSGGAFGSLLENEASEAPKDDAEEGK